MNRRQFLATSAAVTTTPCWSSAAEGDLLKMRDIYNKGLGFSPLATSLDGGQIRVEGFMAPPLKADSLFFVLTKMPMAVCPFCEPGGEWPEDILAVYTRRKYEVVSFSRKILVQGTLRLSEHIDPGTGFFSKVRLENSTFRRA
ncbi:hypothetical protein [Tropicimonas marinistellae]|uniref:hypothetical protein n=1 Tax=Tropicimonas marinistellae TaxID=1739787 RepID=UPI00082E9C97|nr:hypothetical protein [Tropicimonas marinistellae]